MNEESKIPETVTVKKPLDKETADKYATEIQELHLKEIEHHAIARANDSTGDERMEALEDGYLAELKKIKLAKKFPEDQFNEYQLDRPCRCDYANLETPAWDDYIS
jgi:hypothetical protein